MTNLTLTVDATLLRKARILALERRTSVNALVREFIENMVNESMQRSERAAAWRANLAESTIHSVVLTPRLTRQETYDTDPRMQRLFRIGQSPDAAAGTVAGEVTPRGR